MRTNLVPIIAHLRELITDIAVRTDLQIEERDALRLLQNAECDLREARAKLQAADVQRDIKRLA